MTLYVRYLTVDCCQAKPNPMFSLSPSLTWLQAINNKTNKTNIAKMLTVFSGSMLFCIKLPFSLR